MAEYPAFLRSAARRKDSSRGVPVRSRKVVSTFLEIEGSVITVPKKKRDAVYHPMRTHFGQNYIRREDRDVMPRTH